METLRSEAAAETDAVFSPERLRAQRLHVSRRLEHLGHPARVITFPGRTAGHQFGSSTPRPVRRWVAAAAAAGLFIGVATGLFLDRETGRSAGRHPWGSTARQTAPHGAGRSRRRWPNRARAAGVVRVGRSLPLGARAGRRAPSHPGADRRRRADAARPGSQSPMSGSGHPFQVGLDPIHDPGVELSSSARRRESWCVRSRHAVR